MIFPKKILVPALGVIVASLLVFFLFLKKDTDFSGGGTSPESSEQAKKPEDLPLPVKVIPAQKSQLIIKLKAPGEAVTSKKINMKADIAGIVKRLKVEESQHVKQGELLVELDDKEYRLELERVEASRLKVLSELLVEKRFAESEEEPPYSNKQIVQKAKEEFEKARELYQKGLISRKDFEEASVQYELDLIESGEKKEEILAASKGLTQAVIEVKRAKINLEKTRILAPFSGIITDIKISPQEHLTSGRELFTLVNISQIQVHVKVLESEIGRIKVGREVVIRFSAYPEKVFKGKVKAISPVINPEDKTCNVIVEVANPEEEIKPGMHAEVEIPAEIHKDRLLIPQEAVLVRAGRKLAFVVENGLAKWRYIKVGLENEVYAEVLEGVKEGEFVIIEGHFTLAHDARVRIVK
ncbi:Macrolide export protein MacA [subsurface metagenome]